MNGGDPRAAFPEEAIDLPFIIIPDIGRIFSAA